jgi:hypothetical protein
MKQLFLVAAVLIIFQSQFCYGQYYDWKQGLIIHNNGDTVHGYIDDRVITTNQRVCYFKNGDNGEIAKYRPFQILGYRFSSGKYYISKIIRFSEKEDSMFLEFLFKGRICIYHYLGAQERYFIEKDGQLTELENSEIKVRIGDKEYTKNKNEYIGVLNIILQDAHIPNEIQKTSYQSESLIKLAKTYNEKMCPGEICTIYEKEKKVKAKFDFGLTIGMSNKTMEHAYSLESDYELKNEASYFGGITLSLYNLPGGFKNFSVNGEALITSYYLEDKLNKCLNIPLFVGFRVIDNKIYPQVEVGLSQYFKQSEFNISPMFGIGVHYKNVTGPGYYIKARIEHIPAYFRFGAGIVF